MNITKAYNFINNDSRVSSSGLIITVDLQSFVDEGYEAIINLLPDDNEHARKNEQEDIEALGIHYFHISVDWDSPTKADYKEFERAMLATKDNKIHIHCAANYRATAFYGIYAYHHLDWSKQQILDFTAPLWQLSDYPVWANLVDDLSNGI